MSVLAPQIIVKCVKNMANYHEIAEEYKRKLNFYFVALAFTLLAASVQSAPLNEMLLISKIFELISWASLLVCGLTSLSYLEFLSKMYEEIDTSHDDSLTGKIRDGAAGNVILMMINNATKYKIAKYSFVFGLICVLLSRGIHGICN